MAKLKKKTHKGMKKRFKVTATGKVKHHKANRGHFFSGKTSKQKRSLRCDGVITGIRAAKIVDGLSASL